MFSELANRVDFFIRLFVSDNLPSYFKCPIINVSFPREKPVGVLGDHKEDF